jgi:flagellar assembly protein FliH
MLPRFSKEAMRNVGRPPSPGVSKEVNAALEKARADAEEILSQARAQAEAVREEARQQGYSAGEAAARQEVEARLTEVWEKQTYAVKGNIQAIIDSIIDARQELWEQSEQEMVSLVLEVARKVIKTEVQQNPNVIGEMIRHAMRRVVDKETVRIRVNPDDIERVRGEREELLRVLDGIRHLEIDDDRRIGPGGCVIETNGGTIDARIDTQFEQLEEAMKAA